MTVDGTVLNFKKNLVAEGEARDEFAEGFPIHTGYQLAVSCKTRPNYL